MQRNLSHLSIVLAAALVAACGGSEQDGFDQIPRGESTALSSCVDAGMAFGVDVSQYDNNDAGALPNWEKIRDAGVQFAFARISDGLDFPDPNFDSNWAAMKQVGIIRGSYQYFEVDQDPHAQARMVLQHISDFGPGDLPPVIDVETLDGLDAGPAVGALAAWVDDIHFALQRRPIVYSSVRVWNEFNNPSLDADLWVVDVNSPSCALIPAVFGNWTFWQYSGTGTVPGLTEEPADLDRFNGTLAQLKIYALGDAGPADAGSIDAGSIDAGSVDAGSIDAGSIDAGSIDAGSIDAGSIDAGSIDAGSIDAGAEDAGSVDAGARDAGSTDAGGQSIGCPADTVDASGVCISICGEGTVLDGGVCTASAEPSSGGCASGGASLFGCAGLLALFSLRRKRTLRAPREPC